MINILLNKIFGSKNEREIKRRRPLVAEIGTKEPALARLSDHDLRAKTEEFKKRLADGATLDDLLPDAFAVCREMAKRKLEMRHFDVQLIGGMVLHQGKISEMKTGEGKTLVATLALYLNALEGKGAHLVTVNDYLAKRDAQWMGPLYHHLGLSVGVIQHEASFLYDPTYEAEDKRLQHLRPCTRQEAYRADITYGTNNEFGFDYLRDNMVGDLADCVQRELHYAIVDEVDSILIDEARTPLIISGPTEDSTDLYYRIDRIIPMLKRDVDYTIEEKTRTAALTEEGNEKVERALGVTNLYDLANMDLVHHVVQALRAHAMYRRDVDYVVKDGEVIIVDEFIECDKRGGRVLVGTISLETSERLAGYLVRHGIKRSVLSAKHHEKEAEIIAQAGRKGAVTIATNMAGRGTDILLGGNPDFLFKKALYADQEMPPERQAALLHQIRAECEEEKKEVVALGGLHILGTERHESRRIDNQLRGRAGRQGDPGSSRFYLSLEDDLLRIFGSDRISKIMLKLGMEEGVPIEAKMVTRAIENAQKKVEAHHFEIRKQLLDYDDVLNKQREVIYERRRMILGGEDLSEDIKAGAEEVLDALLDIYCPKETYAEEWDLKGLADALYAQFAIDIKDSVAELKDMGFEALREELVRKIHEAYAAKERELGRDLLRQLEKMVMLRTIDTLWKDHLLGMDSLREGIGLRGYGQKDPLIEYKREAFDMFAAMMDRCEREVLEHLFRVQIVQGEQPPPVQARSRRPPQLKLNRGEDAGGGNGDKTVRRTGEKVGRNDPCPCGSGKK